MKLHRFKVSNTPHLTVTCHGDLDISGGREGEVAIKVYGGQEDLQMQREGESFTLTVTSRCKIACPHGTTLTVPQANGNLRVRGVDGPVAVEQVNGDTVLKDVGPTTITGANGNVRARSVQGDLRLDDVMGDLSVRGIEGVLSIRQGNGNLTASYLEGGLQADIIGDCTLKTDFTPGCEYTFKTGSNATLKFPTQTRAHFDVTAQGHINHKVDWAEISAMSDSTLLARVGEADENAAKVTLEAIGSATLRSRSEDKAFVFAWSMDDDMGVELESMAEELERNIEVHMARMEAKLKDIDHEAIRLKAVEAAEKVRLKALRGAERARLKAERAERRWERLSPRPPRPPRAPRAPRRGRATSSPPPPAPPVTSDERMVVLRMVQEGKISPDEAAQLLEAMEG